MPDPIFRLVCLPTALDGTPEGWAAEMLRDGQIALLPDDGGLDSINALIQALDFWTVLVVRRETTAAEQAKTVIGHAGSLPLIWIGTDFSDDVRAWAQKRGPMTLLVECDGPLPEEERKRIERFVSVLGRQAE